MITFREPSSVSREGMCLILKQYVQIKEHIIKYMHTDTYTHKIILLKGMPLKCEGGDVKHVGPISPMIRIAADSFSILWKQIPISSKTNYASLLYYSNILTLIIKLIASSP